jgi:uncharacterized protein (TIGR00251 family)
MTRDWCCQCGNAIRLAVHVMPNAKKSEVIGPLEGSLKIRLQAQAIEGKANAALIRYLAQALDVPRGAVLVTHGLTNKRKLVEVQAPQLTVAGVKALLWNE